MFYYRYNNNILISIEPYTCFEEIDMDTASKCDNTVYILSKRNPLNSRRSFCVSDAQLIFITDERPEVLLNKSNSHQSIPEWLNLKIRSRQVMSVNTEYPNWDQVLDSSLPKCWRINVIGLGDVGGILSAGLMLLGCDSISRLGLYDRDINKTKRWHMECGQIIPPLSGQCTPDVIELNDDNLFDCDMFVFCVSRGVPEVGSKTADVRMAQFVGNSEIIKTYAKAARSRHFKGIFAVVSDPVDLLSKVVFLESNKNENNEFDFMGLSPEQVRGYGLGVMNARAVFYAKQRKETAHYTTEGRAFGPHGDGLIIADSIENYDEELSLSLTEKARNSNIEVRSTGFKPYIAPALSSGSLSIIATITGKWNYSATFMGGIYMGAKNRLLRTGTEIETLNLQDPLLKRIQNTSQKLRELL